jgi:outer membrane receptor protein involved in Fe transport
MRTRHCPRLLAVAIAALIAPAAALAQLEEIIVTAQKREESVQDVPIAVTAFDMEALEAQQIVTFGDFRFAVPNVSFAKGNFTGNNFSIRGIGSPAVAAGSDSGVEVSVNEVPVLFPRLFETAFFDVQQVAVLRGPQGTLFGRNSTGGAINMITNTADPSELSGYVQGQYGDYQHQQVEVQTGGEGEGAGQGVVGRRCQVCRHRCQVWRSLGVTAVGGGPSLAEAGGGNAATGPAVRHAREPREQRVRQRRHQQRRQWQ